MLSIIGCGNAVRSDDGVGIYVTTQLQSWVQERNLSAVRVFDAGTAGIEVMFQARGSNSLIIVDASASGSEPGSIFKASGSELHNEHQPKFSLHDFRWDHAIHAGRQIFKDDFPSDITVYLIEARDISFGLELSSPVKDAADKVIDMIKRDLEQLL